MCMVSVINDYGRQQIPASQWNRSNFDEFKEILRRLDALDAKLGQPDCVAVEKTEWMHEVERRLTALESPTPITE